MSIKRSMDHDEHLYHLLSTQEKLKQGTPHNQVVDLIDTIFYQAIEINASDIHFQPDAKMLRVRYRLDGILHDQSSITHDLSPQILSRIKVLSSLDIAEKRLPQDGKCKLVIHPSNQQIDLRISTFPSIYGEKIVVRILNRSNQILHLNSLGMNNELLNHITTLAHLPYGFFLVTGPTGSGKTTTLYAMLSILNQSEKNIITMEDPVEYDLEGITQSQVNIKTGFTFENGLRSMLRQDPDIIMIGEIRDQPTVHIALEASLTGHLVLSTLHTNDAVGALTRLLDMGIEPYLLNAAVSGVLAQRLARKLCNHCKQETILSPEEQQRMFIYGYHNLKKVYKANGCHHCLQFGYKGRIGIFELLLMTDDIRRLVMQKASTEIIRQAAIEQGMKTLTQDGITKIEQGIISLEEFFITLGISN